MTPRTWFGISVAIGMLAGLALGTAVIVITHPFVDGSHACGPWQEIGDGRQMRQCRDLGPLWFVMLPAMEAAFLVSYFRREIATRVRNRSSVREGT